MHVAPRKVRAFEDEQSFYDWLTRNWSKESEVWIKIHKVSSGLASITPKEAIDVVLCWGWIDGIRKGLDDKSFLQRYTPRGKKSVWSQINVANVERLTKAGRMQPPGKAQVEAAKADGRWDKAYSVSKSEVPADLLAAIESTPKALATYRTLSSQNRFALTFRMLNIKTVAGRKKRIETFVAMLEKGETLYPNTSRSVVAPKAPDSARTGPRPSTARGGRRGART